MNKGDIIFVRSADSGSESSSAWDDRRLREAYDRATKIADETVAKRIAMETNSCQKGSSKNNSQKSKKKNNSWKIGKSCRATFKEDGQEYEAVITDIIDDFECVVKYLGYDNSEVVLINSLKPSKGSQEVAKQIQQASVENQTDGDSGTERTDPNNYSFSDSTPTPIKKKKTHKKNKVKLPNLPNIPMLPNLPMDMPIPPPMPFPTSSGESEEQQTLSSMLLSWYLSGYYCGLYQGMNQSKKRK